MQRGDRPRPARAERTGPERLAEPERVVSAPRPHIRLDQVGGPERDRRVRRDLPDARVTRGSSVSIAASTSPIPSSRRPGGGTHPPELEPLAGVGEGCGLVEPAAALGLLPRAAAIRADVVRHDATCIVCPSALASRRASDERASAAFQRPSRKSIAARVSSQPASRRWRVRRRARSDGRGRRPRRRTPPSSRAPSRRAGTSRARARPRRVRERAADQPPAGATVAGEEQRDAARRSIAADGRPTAAERAARRSRACAGSPAKAAARRRPRPGRRRDRARSRQPACLGQQPLVRVQRLPLDHCRASRAAGGARPRRRRLALASAAPGAPRLLGPAGREGLLGGAERVGSPWPGEQCRESVFEPASGLDAVSSAARSRLWISTV